MALYTKAQLVELCGLKRETSRSYIRNNVERGKLIFSGDYIDDTLPVNAEFIRRRIQAKNGEPIEARTSTSNKVLKYEEPKIDLSRQDLDKQLKQQELLKKEAETRLLNLREEKIRGEIVPIELIKNLMVTHTKSIVTAQKDGIEDLLININKEARLTGAQLAKLRGKMVEILNIAVDKAISSTKKDLDVIIGQISTKREVGEHD